MNLNNFVFWEDFLTNDNVHDNGVLPDFDNKVNLLDEQPSVAGQCVGLLTE